MEPTPSRTVEGQLTKHEARCDTSMTKKQMEQQHQHFTGSHRLTLASTVDLMLGHKLQFAIMPHSKV